MHSIFLKIFSPFSSQLWITTCKKDAESMIHCVSEKYNLKYEKIFVSEINMDKACEIYTYIFTHSNKHRFLLIDCQKSSQKIYQFFLKTFEKLPEKINIFIIGNVYTLPKTIISRGHLLYCNKEVQQDNLQLKKIYTAIKNKNIQSISMLANLEDKEYYALILHTLDCFLDEMRKEKNYLIIEEMYTKWRKIINIFKMYSKKEAAFNILNVYLNL